MTPRRGERSDVISVSGTSMGNAPCYVVAFTARQLGQLLSGLKSLACSGSLCIKNRSSFTLYPT